MALDPRNQPVHPAELIPLRALDSAMRAFGDAVPNPFDIPRNSNVGQAIDGVAAAFQTEATRLFGEAKARDLLDLVQNSDDDLDTCISRALGRRRVHVLLCERPGEDTSIVAVLDGPNAGVEALNWMDEDHGDAAVRRYFEVVDVFPADRPAALPSGISDSDLDTIAMDISGILSHWAHRGIDVDSGDIRPALAAFLGDVLDNAARTAES